VAKSGDAGVNGAHDLGGMHGFGPVEVEPDEPVFHAEWERKVYGLRAAARGRGIYNAHQSRFGIESMPPAEYLRASYYERWLYSLEKNLIETGTLTREELEARTRLYSERPEAPVPRRDDPALAQRLVQGIRRGFPARRPLDRPPRFAVGDAVRARNVHPHGHIRLPRYARGKRGLIVRADGAFDLPDLSAARQGEHPEHAYGVRFEAHELWGDSAEPNAAVYLDLWESYLEPA
jgi:nitrile hydratase